MPELPEVESIRIQLSKFLVGHKIEKVEVRYKKKFEGNKNLLLGGKIKRVERFGKALSIELDNGYSILIHVKLTGQPIYRGPNLKHTPELSKKVVGGVPGKHTHVILYLDKDGVLYYNDYRKFGWIKVLETKKVGDDKFIKFLGPEPLDGLTLKTFKKIVKVTRRPIKILLMDQSKISGVGNIYANDALFLAGVYPEKRSSELNDNEIKRTFSAIEEALKRGLKYHGASEQAFVTPDGKEGKYQDHALIYGKEGESCPNRCGGVIKKKKLGGRGTYFCPKCQK